MRILLGTDGSRDGLNAIYLGSQIVTRLKAETTLLCVVRKEDKLERSLKSAAQVMQESGAVFTPVGRIGHLTEEMLTHAQQGEYDLAIVGYRARSYLKKVLGGTLSTHIAHKMPIPVLIVRDRCDTISNVLIGVSGGGFTGECSEWGGRIALAFGAHVTLLHISPVPPLMYAGLEDVVETLPEFLQTDTPDAHALRQAIAHLIGMGVQADIHLVHGTPEHELLRAARNQDVGLLVIGSAWAAQPVSRLLLRNMTKQVLLNTHQPVLVIRSCDS